MDLQSDVIIIGAGPAGMTAAIYLARANIKTMIIEPDAPGGKLIKTAEISNWPGIVKTTGVDLALQMYNHISQLPVTYQYGLVEQIQKQDDLWEVNCSDGSSFLTKAVIVASGTKERLMEIPGEKEMIGQGISFCAVCDGSLFRDQEVIVIGGGNSALEEALYLTQFVKKVTIVIRRDEFRGDPIVVDKILNDEKIEVIYQHIPVAVIAKDGKVDGLEIADVTNQKRRTIDTQAIFPYIGAIPATSFVRDLGITDEAGYLIVNEHMATKIPGIYGAGDVCVKNLRQVVTAASDGAIAAVSISHYLK